MTSKNYHTIAATTIHLNTQDPGIYPWRISLVWKISEFTASQLTSDAVKDNEASPVWEGGCLASTKALEKKERQSKSEFNTPSRAESQLVGGQ